jgi:hypothetical protein
MTTANGQMTATVEVLTAEAVKADVSEFRYCLKAAASGDLVQDVSAAITLPCARLQREGRPRR